MFILPLLLACSSVIPDTTPNPVDKLAGYLDVRLGQKVEDVPGLVRAPKFDHYEEKEEAYTRPADQAFFMLGSTLINSNETPYYFVHDGVLRSVLVMVKDDVVLEYGMTTPDTILSRYSCRTLLESLTKMLGAAEKQTDDSAETFLWTGDLSTVRVIAFTESDGNRTCGYRTQLGTE
jgi:hypothetical protein